MKTTTRNFALTFAVASANLAAPAFAHEVKADDHAPIGVMADHAHKKGEVMISLRAMHMAMSENQIGTATADPDTIATTVPNRFFGEPMQPPTVRIVPTEMDSEMVMAGIMYAPTDWVTLTAMTSYITREMSHVTYAGATGTDVQGEFTTATEGFGDVTFGAIFPVLGHSDAMAESRQELAVRAAISAPTGATDETAQILTPFGTTPTVRTPYQMQIGSGTWDLKPAVTYKGWAGRLGYGAQYAGTIRTGTNDAGYRFGDIHELSAWASYRPAQWLSLSMRARGRTTGQIDGIDSAIVGPVQTANPDFQGGERLDLLGGVNVVGTHGPLAGHRLGIELGLPVYQDLNGPQLAGDWSLTLGWQKAF